MELVRKPSMVAGPSRCAGCGTEQAEERCGHCGAAAQAGPYRVLQVLSRSQHGAMYLAEDEAGARVALKELVFNLVPSAQELDAFAREAQLLQRLRHPRIPRFLRSFSVGQGVHLRLYLAQQYLPGRSLAQRLESESFDEAAVLALARQALEVLGHLHSLSPVVVHRDVKPANLIVGADGKLSLVDFGSARATKRDGTHRATLVGTFGYMAPEQLGGTVDARSDLYALGATLIHLLSRVPPEQLLGPGMALDFRKRINVSARTERFLARLIAVRPQERFASAQEALAFLDGARDVRRPALLRVGVVSLGLLAGALGAAAALRVGPREVPVQQERPRQEVPVPPAPQAEVKPAAVPPPGKPGFPWVQADWNFNRPGGWVLDESGRGHHVALPSEGHQTGFFGLEWDGTADLTLPDAPEYAPAGPFTLTFDFWPSKEPLTRSATLVSRGDPTGTFAWAVQVVPTAAGRVLRFTIADEAGRRSVSELSLPDSSSSSLHYYASFDPKSGLQRVSELGGDCRVVTTETKIRPARTLPPSEKLHLVTGLRGMLSQVELIKGLMGKLPGPKCSYGAQRLNED